MSEPFVERKAYLGRANQVAIRDGLCVHSGCCNNGYDLTENLCPTHFVTDVLAKLEDILHEANLNWTAAVEAEKASVARADEKPNHHLMANDGSAERQPTGKTGRQRLTPKTNISNIEEIG